MSTLRTERLTLRRLLPQDIDWVLAMESDPEVMRYTTGAIAATAARRAELLRAISATEPDGLGHWCIERNQTAIGWTSLTPLEDTGRIHLAYRLVRTDWGQGYATEAGRATINYAWSFLRLAECAAIVWPENVASACVLAKLQFHQEGLTRYYGHEVHIYNCINPFHAAV